MDSWMPWTIARNFVRAFSPTLVVVIVWDLWRNLSHLSTTTGWTVVSDTAALGVIIAIRLAPPIEGLREQVTAYLRWKWEARFASAVLLALVFFDVMERPNPLDVLLGFAAWALYADLARVCRIEFETSKKVIKAIGIACGVLTYVLSGVVSSVAQIREGTFPWRDVIYLMVLVLIVTVVLALKWWGQASQPLPVVQELGLNRHNPS